MAISFPISTTVLADKIDPKNFSMDLDDQQSVSGLASGEILATQVGPRLWFGSAKTLRMSHGRAQELAAVLRALDGSIDPFYLYDMRKCFPLMDPDGSTLGAATPTISAVGANNKSLSIAGLPAGYALSAGDKWCAGYDGTRRFFGEFSETATADGSGDLFSVEVRPHLRPGFGSGQSISLIKPSAKVKLSAKSLKVTEDTAIWSRVSFAFQQTLAQD